MRVYTEVKRLTQRETELIDSIREMNDKPADVIYQDKTYNDGELWFVLPDVHYPFQDEALMRKVRQCIADNVPHGVVLAGDWLDLYTLGSYNTNSLENLRNITLSQEYDAGLKGIKDLEKVLTPDAKRVYIWGNHEDRYFRQMKHADTGKFGGELKNPNDALRLKEYGYEVLTDWKDDFYTVGDLDIMHGVFTSVHVAKKHLEAHGRSVMFGHTHRVQTHFTAHEGAFNIGTLADIKHKAFSYMPRMQRENWSQGFAAITVIGGKAYVTMITVRNNKFIFNGKVY